MSSEELKGSKASINYDNVSSGSEDDGLIIEEHEESTMIPSPTMTITSSPSASTASILSSAFNSPPNSLSTPGVPYHHQMGGMSELTITEYSNPLMKSMKKRSRTIMTPYQSRVLRKVLEQTAFPSTEMRESLAKMLGMKPRTVQIWFQNQRQKSRQKSPTTTTTSAFTSPLGTGKVNLNVAIPNGVERWARFHGPVHNMAPGNIPASHMSSNSGPSFNSHNQQQPQQQQQQQHFQYKSPYAMPARSPLVNATTGTTPNMANLHITAQQPATVNVTNLYTSNHNNNINNNNNIGGIVTPKLPAFYGESRPALDILASAVCTPPQPLVLQLAPLRASTPIEDPSSSPDLSSIKLPPIKALAQVAAMGLEMESRSIPSSSSLMMMKRMRMADPTGAAGTAPQSIPNSHRPW